jgi:hypothetical protein
MANVLSPLSGEYIIYYEISLHQNTHSKSPIPLSAYWVNSEGKKFNVQWVTDVPDNYYHF